MENEKINWMPYPENYPEKNGEYLVTMQSKDTKFYTSLLRFNSHRKSYNESGIKIYIPCWESSEDDSFTYANVIAFAELPKPYKS